MSVQTFLAELPVKCFNERVVRQFPRPTEVQDDTLMIRPQIHVP